MKSEFGLGWKLGLLAILALMVGVGTWRQYLKYEDGRGIYSTLLGPSASSTTEVIAFLVLPGAFVIAAFLYALRDLR